MEIDSSTWPEINTQLRQVALPADELQLLIRHLTDRLVGHFGAETFDVWRAKEGLHRHDAAEVAAVVVAKLAPILNRLPASTVTEAANDGTIASPVAFPWDETFPFG